MFSFVPLSFPVVFFMKYTVPEGCLNIPEWLEAALLLPPEMANMTEMEKALFFVNQKMNRLEKKLGLWLMFINKTDGSNECESQVFGKDTSSNFYGFILEIPVKYG